ncbi:ATPase SWSAP1 isoform X2 [Narcine bancroftii]|uniref:ATPase SWSAP1 isoform X2 n=1 Tax=Narcine bancroftii TaxID=1343680 RepID=UPI003831F958
MAGALLQVLVSLGAGDVMGVGGPGAAAAAAGPGVWESSDLGGCLLLGEKSCAKTALLFHAAAAAAGQQGRRVLFLAPRPIQAMPAALLHLEPHSLRRVQFVYPCSASGLLHAVACLHEKPESLPSLIVLDGLDEFLQGCSGLDLSRQAGLVAALLRDSAAWISGRLEPSVECQTLTQKENAADLGLQVVQRYFPVKCTVTDQQCHVEGTQSYLVSFSGLVKSESREVRAVLKEDCTWELLCEADNISRIRHVTREEGKNEEAQNTWGEQEGRSNCQK